MRVLSAIAAPALRALRAIVMAAAARLTILAS
jgi:hypothetical protein